MSACVRVFLCRPRLFDKHPVPWPDQCSAAVAVGFLVPVFVRDFGLAGKVVLADVRAPRTFRREILQVLRCCLFDALRLVFGQHVVDVVRSCGLQQKGLVAHYPRSERWYLGKFSTGLVLSDVR